MKKISLFLLFVILLSTGYGQSQRLVLLEEFTSSTCGPCAGVNPTLHTWQVQNPDKFTSIYYHMNFPSVGDPMYAANPTENSARQTYYNIPSIPQAALDGNYFYGNAYNLTLNTINTRWAMPSPVEIKLQHTLAPGNDSVYSTMLVNCTQAFSGNLTAHHVIIEKWIHFNTAPGSNGEKDFYNVMKKMLPGSNGTSLPSSMNPGDYVLLEGSWKFGTVYDPTQIASVGFVQDKTTKEVFQAANSSVDSFTMPYANDLQVTDVKNVPSITCNDHLNPVVVVRNNGNDVITGMTINYRVNDGTWATHTWNGSLQTLQKASIQLPEYIFTILPQNTLTIYTTNPNNSADQYPKNDTLDYTIKASALTGNAVSVIIRTDDAPQETTWEIVNSLGTAVASGGPYSLPSHLYTENVTLPQADCYKFIIYDSGNNGVCCVNGSGAYQFKAGGTLLKQGGTFTSSESIEFRMAAPAGTIDPAANALFSVSPNPVEGTARISFNMEGNGTASLSIYTALGQLVSTRSLGNLPGGHHETVFDARDLNPGIYILRMNTGSNVYSRKITVVR